MASVKTDWLKLAKTGIWIVAVAGSFFIPPPVALSSEQSTYTHFATFIATALTGIMFLPMKLYDNAHQAKWWAALSTLLLLAVAATFFYYTAEKNRTTFSYNDQLIVKGDLTYEARQYTATYSAVLDSALLEDAGGRTELVWTKESVEKNRLWLVGIYSASIVLSTLCILSVIQTVHAGKGRV